MKILIVSQYFWPENFKINDLAQELSARGHQVTVLTGQPNYPGGEFFPGHSFFKPFTQRLGNIKIIRVPLIPRKRGRSMRLALNYLSFVLFASWAALFRCRGEFDVIFVYEPSPFTVGIPAAFLRWLKKIPMIFWVQDLWPESLQATGAVRSPGILAMAGWMVRWIYRRCDRVLVQSRGFTEPAISAGADPDRIEYFPNWAESLYQPVAVDLKSPKLEKLPTGFRILFAGNLGEAQSLETIVSAAEKLKDCPDIHWILLGSGRREPWLRKIIAGKNLQANVHLLGQQPVESMPHYFARADVLLVTLKKDPAFALTIPSKIQSYLACGKALLGALNGEGARVIQESGGGLAVAAEDAEALANSVQILYKLNPEERERMGQQGRTYYDNHFERSHLLDRLEMIMDQTVKAGLCES